jgi:hypothetical protein
MRHRLPVAVALLISLLTVPALSQTCEARCANVCSSGFLDQIRKDREDFIARFGEPTERFKELDDPVLVEVVGVGFFDRMHGQRGRALPSGIELYPVISFKALE